MKTAYNIVDNSAVVTINVAAASGIGPSYEINALHPEKRRLGFVVGEGANASIDIAPKRGFSMALGNNTNSTSLLASADFLAGDIFHGGFSLTLDANLNLTIIPKAGFGMGELMTFKKFGVSGAAGLSDEVVSGHHEEKHPDNKSSVSEPGCYLEECERGRPFPEMKRGGS